MRDSAQPCTALQYAIRTLAGVIKSGSRQRGGASNEPCRCTPGEDAYVLALISAIQHGEEQRAGLLALWLVSKSDQKPLLRAAKTCANLLCEADVLLPEQPPKTPPKQPRPLTLVA
ncbi:MAG: hypothetical protein AAGC95_17230 [Pseudomonadota bacterium]